MLDYAFMEKALPFLLKAIPVISGTGTVLPAGAFSG